MADGLLLDLPYINIILYWYWKKHRKSMFLSLFLIVYIAQHTQHHHQVVHPVCVCVLVTPITFQRCGDFYHKPTRY